MAGVSIQNLTRRPLPRLPFDPIAKKVLPEWDISLVFVGQKRAHSLNKSLRRKTYAPNVLSYRVGNRSGEVIICPAVAAREAADFKLRTEHFILLLFIHALLHIKGWVHSGRMEKYERKLLYETTHRYRDRHRHVPGQSRRR